MRDPPMEALVERFTKRCMWPVVIKELQPRGKQSEFELLARAAKGADRLVVLDERGKNSDSTSFARQLSGFQDRGCRTLLFLIGGAEGMNQELRSKADALLAFGQATWPHMLARVMLCEQIYRASSIIQNHPYHREG